MPMEENILLRELKRLSQECRLQSRSSRPQLALLRMAASLDSLSRSFSNEPVENSPLSKREKEILFHVSQGFTNREIASALNISEKTIEFHLKSIFRKTESDSRTEAVKNALTKKWI